LRQNQHTFYIDKTTFSNASELAKRENLSVSAMVRILINHCYYYGIDDTGKGIVGLGRRR